MIDVRIQECICWESRALNVPRMIPAELRRLTFEAAVNFEKNHCIREAQSSRTHLEALYAALHKTLAFIGIAPEGAAEAGIRAWQELPLKEVRPRALKLSGEKLDYMTHAVAAIFIKQKIDGFRSPRVLSEVKYRLAGTYLHRLNAEIEGIPAKKYAHCMEIEVVTLARVQTLQALGKSAINRHPSP